MFPSIVFFGTPSFGAQLLEYLLDHHVPVVAVVTQPDRPKGRSSELIASPVKEVWQKRVSSVPLWQPEKCSNPDFLAQIADVKADLYVVVAFGQILPKKLLDIPPLGCINVHASLLPKYRGAAPIQRALLNGEKVDWTCIAGYKYFFVSSQGRFWLCSSNHQPNIDIMDVTPELLQSYFRKKECQEGCGVYCIISESLANNNPVKFGVREAWDHLQAKGSRLLG